MMWVLLVAVAAAGLLLLGAPYVPTHQSELDQLFADLGSAEGRLFADLGSGDGRVLKRAKAAGFEVVGFEIHPLFWLVSKFRLGWKESVRFEPWQQADLSAVDVVYIFSTSWHVRSRAVPALPDSATIVVYGAQPEAFAGRISVASGSAVIYRPVAHE